MNQFLRPRSATPYASVPSLECTFSMACSLTHMYGFPKKSIDGVVYVVY